MDKNLALSLLYEASTKAQLTKEAHLVCEQAYKLLLNEIQPEKASDSPKVDG